MTQGVPAASPSARRLRLRCRQFAEKGRHGRVFIGPKGATLRRSNWHVLWSRATTQAGVTGLHFHDLRHTGNTLAAGTGASLADLMRRMGHSSTRAAMLYQHATDERDQAIADALDVLLKQASDESAENQDSAAEGEATGT